MMTRLMKPILDATCGSRMMWFDKQNPLTIFMDNRRENCEISDGRTLVVEPDVVGDFRRMPFHDKTFKLVLFDPPHLNRAGSTSWLAKKYGVLLSTWREDLRAGFEECFRVLDDYGVLVFKWSEIQIPLKEVLALTERKPLFGGRYKSKSMWVVFMKEV